MMQTTTPDELKYILKTSRGAEISVEDFTARFAHLSARALRAEAAGYIEYRRRSLDDHAVFIFKLLVEIGSALEAVFQSLQQEKSLLKEQQKDVSHLPSFEDWLLANAPRIHHDTALNYRNLYKSWRNLPAQLEDDIELLKHFDFNLLYRLARKTVSQDARDWFISYVREHKDETLVDARLTLIARFPEIRARLDCSPPELNIEQAFALALIFDRLDPLIAALILEHKVKYAEVAEALNKCYLDFCRALEDERPFKTWMLLLNDDFHFSWNEKTSGIEKRVALREMTPLDMHKYLEFRSWLHYQDTAKEKARAVADWHRDGRGNIIFSIDAQTLALFDESDAGTVEVELLTQTIKYSEQIKSKS